jgi:hypothetical protein
MQAAKPLLPSRRPADPYCCLWLQDQLNTYNANVKNAISQLQDSCGTLNCLNMTDIAPSKRNLQAGNNCVSGSCVQ